MKRTWTSEELLEHFTLLPDELTAVGNKSGATRLGFAVLFKCFQYEGRFLGRATLTGEKSGDEKKSGSIGILEGRQTPTTEPMDTSQQFCPNVTCSARGKTGEGTITIHDRKRQRYRCRVCRQTFSARRGTMFEGLRKPSELIVLVIILLCYGCPVQAIVQAFGLDERTVADWRDRAGQHCQKVHVAVVEQGKLDLVHVQADEIRVKGRKMVAWMGLAMMVSTRLWLAGTVQMSRDKGLADALLRQVRRAAKLLRPVLFLTDGWAAYVRRVGASEIPVAHGRGREQEPLGQELTRRGNSKATEACS